MNDLEYSLIRFSPVPEDVEPVNVAVVVWGPPPRVLFDERFPRLGSITPDFDAHLLRLFLQDLPAQIADGDRSGLLRATSQIQVTTRRRLLPPLTTEAEVFLRKRYLSRAAGRTLVKAKAEREAVEMGLDRFLRIQLEVARPEIHVRMRPADFLPRELVERHIPEDGLRVARVITGRSLVLAIDGVDRRMTLGFAEKRAMTIGATFFALGGLQQELLEKYRRRLRRAVVFFGRAPEHHSPRLEYLEETLRRESDLSCEAGQPSADLLQAARDATADLL